MKTVKEFPKIYESNRMFGLEFLDLLIFAFVYLLVFFISKNLFLNFAVLLSSYLTLRIYKLGKPPHWTGSVIRFLLSPRRFQSGSERRKELIS
jgi:hypothetical protein